MGRAYRGRRESEMVGRASPSRNEMRGEKFMNGELSGERIFPLSIDRRSGRFLVEVQGDDMPEQGIDLPQGTLDLLILRTLALGPRHGWAISERIHQVSSKVLLVRQGSLYPALHRLERRGWIKARWGASENNRKAKYYELTKNGQKQLEAERNEWEKLAAAVAQVLEAS